ncbi:hypothetical protein PR048_005985 [Dryococelus australis]|uniref:Reverse transcriptase/retrotransposon-derived protein RNase H-like domain-containing protein n=1 Tax=Dryococelus australis TaxID=614101 RepID=A0ABQ9IAS3_9NEOP|nr:hypothetical protein PR048_005985 [Dryococelus australis]
MLLGKFESKLKILKSNEPGVPLKVESDASQLGSGAVLAHIYPDKSEKPIAFASRKLMPSCTIVVRNSVLDRIFEFKIELVKSQNHGNADALSRVPLKITEPDLIHVQYVDGKATYLDYVQDGEIPITEKVVRQETTIDPVLSKVLDYALHIWANFWWPGMDNDIKAVALMHSARALEKPNSAKCELQNWPFPTGLWQSSHVDFLRPWQAAMGRVVKRHVDQMLSSMSHVKLGKGVESGQIPDFADVKEMGKGLCVIGRDSGVNDADTAQLPGT